MGETMDEATMLGPLADKIQFDRVMKSLEQDEKYAKLVIGGGRKGDKGNFVEPTIFLDPPMTSQIYTNEVFGPVLVLTTFKTEEQAIELANETNCGLAGKFSSSFSYPLEAKFQHIILPTVFKDLYCVKMLRVS